MKRVGAVLLVAACAAPPALAIEMDHAGSGAEVSVLFGSVTPARVQVVQGESVHWTNDSIRKHTVTASDRSFDSGTLRPNTSFDHAFATAGSFEYFCRLHPYIRGQVDVHRMLLERPKAPGAPGRPYPLAGRTALAPGTPYEVQADSGRGFERVGEGTVGAGGRIATEVTPATSASYRVVAGVEASPPVDLVVLDRSVSIRSRSKRIAATVSPPGPGAVAVLQLYLKERFGWWPVAKRDLHHQARVTFRVRNRRPVAARVVLTLPDGATALAISNVVRIR